MNATAREGQFLPAVLRAAYPEHTVKRVSAAAGVPHESARNWVRGRSEPSLSVLLRMAARCDRFADALERRLNDRRAARAGNQVLSMARPHAAPDGGQ